jgi:hypothetical protein
MIENNQPRTGKVTAHFAEGKRVLQLRIGELITLQEIRKSGPFAMLTRFREGTWLVQDIIETVRLGLIGGGMPYEEAQTFVERIIICGYIMEHLPTAMTVIYAALSGVPEDDEEPGEPKAPVTSTPTA